jgi:LSD1 subclass zinc finger protein
MTVNEYGPLDFEHVELSAENSPTIAECEGCGTLTYLHGPGIWTCAFCDTVNCEEVEL